MYRIKSFTLGILLSALIAQNAAAQWNVARFDTDRNRMYLTFGLDPALVATLGYARVVPLAGQRVQFSGDVGVVTARLDARDFRVRLGMQTSIVRWRSVHLTGNATVIARGTDNSIYRAFNWGADLTGTLGVYRRGWFAATEFGKDKAIITHLKHSDWYRTNFYPDAKDGWYLDAGGTYRFGLISGFALGRAEVVGRAGWLATEKFKQMTPPGYASVGMGFGF